MLNVHNLIKARAKYKSPTKIMVNMINQKIVKDEIGKFKKYWSGLVDYVLIRNLHTVNNYLKVSNNRIAIKNRYPCPHLYKRMTIDFSGDVKFCAHDWFGYAIVDNLKNNSISNIWNGPKYKTLRRYHEKGEFFKIPLCANCRDWKSVPWDYGYDKVIKKLTNRKEQK